MQVTSQADLIYLQQQQQKLLEQITTPPKSLICPLSKQLLDNNVVTLSPCLHSFDGNALQKYKIERQIEVLKQCPAEGCSTMFPEVYPNTSISRIKTEWENELKKVSLAWHQGTRVPVAAIPASEKPSVPPSQVEKVPSPEVRVVATIPRLPVLPLPPVNPPQEEATDPEVVFDKKLVKSETPAAAKRTESKKRKSNTPVTIDLTFSGVIVNLDDVDADEPKQELTLHRIIASGSKASKEMRSKLVAAHKALINTKDEEGNNCPMLAVIHFQWKKAISWLEEMRKVATIEWGEQNKFGHTILHLAALKKKWRVVQYLRYINAPEDVKDFFGKMAKEYAVGEDLKSAFKASRDELKDVVSDAKKMPEKKAKVDIKQEPANGSPNGSDQPSE